MNTVVESSLRLLRYLPRISLNNINRGPYAKKRQPKQRGQYALRGKKGFGQKGMLQRQKFLPVGYEYHQTPFYMKQPIENYYKKIMGRRQYPPLSLYQLQLLIDTGALSTDEPIDLTSLCNTNFYHISLSDCHFGVNLTDVGMDKFEAKISVEVQHAKEQVIAAVERNGGTITTAYYDINSLRAVINPQKFFGSGEPIPKRLLPPPDCIGYYSDPKNRGYLADPQQIAKERLLLAQKYGYDLPDLKRDPMYKILTLRKDPRQIFYGLEPGWLVNLKDRVILKPIDEALQKYYRGVD